MCVRVCVRVPVFVCVLAFKQTGWYAACFCIIPVTREGTIILKKQSKTTRFLLLLTSCTPGSGFRHFKLKARTELMLYFIRCLEGGWGYLVTPEKVRTPRES